MKQKRESSSKEHEYFQTIRREIHDYMRNGDKIILSRVLLKLFTNHDTPSFMYQEKSKAIMMLLMKDPQSTTSLSVEN